MSRPGRRALRCLAAALAATGALAGPAEAASVARPGDGTIIGVFADPGETNDVSIDLVGSQYVFTDSGAPLTTFEESCTEVTGHRVTCPARDGDQIGVLLGDGDDRVVQNAPRVSGLCGQAGDDRLQGGPAFDSITGGDGDDTLSGGAAGDFLEGQSRCFDSDDPPGAPGLDRLSGEAGDDRLEGSDGVDIMDGGPGIDLMFSFGGDDVLHGGAGDDALSADEGSDQLDGGEGRDILCGGDGADKEHGGPGGDELGVPFTSDTYTCLDLGNDLLDGGPGDDTLDAGPPSGFGLVDSPVPLPGPSDAVNGADVLRGGEGHDTASYRGRTAAVSVSLNGRPDDGSVGEADDVGDDVEVVVGGDGDDSITGSARSDRLDGGAGADLLSGGPGDDELAGGARDGGADRLIGEDGDDMLDGGPGGDQLDGGAGHDALLGAGGDDVLRGGVDSDELTGGPGLDRLHGGAGDDRLDGAAPRLVGADGDDRLAGDEGSDALAGGPGNDVLAGGPGPDTLSGGEGELDAVDYRAARSRVDVSFDGRPNDGAAGEGDAVGSDIERVVGSPADETVSGTTRAEAFEGRDGEDYLDGGAGEDLLRGGAGGDMLWARDGAIDRVSCGRGLDLAVVDKIDRVESDCEVVDAGLTRPRMGRRAVVRPVAGALRLQPPGAHRLVPQPGPVVLGLPARIDASQGTAAVVLAGRRRIRARLGGSRFALRQPRRGAGPAGVRLPARPTRCGARATVVHRLRARARGPLRVRGSEVAGTARRAEWTTDQRCDGTKVRVTAGVVKVRDLRSGRRLELRSGQSYFGRRS